MKNQKNQNMNNIIIQLKQNKKAFTLVELIVVITILAILGTISFISLQGYSKQARDSRRISDISNIKTSLEIFALQKGNYPSPDNGQLTTYSGDTVWTQGTIGDNVTVNLSRNLSKKPLDPLFETEYIYSITYSQKEYELLSIHEGELSHKYSPYQEDRTSIARSGDYQSDRLGNSLLGTDVYAASSYNTKVNGNYNQIFVLTQSYIIPTPSIINSSLDGVGGILTDTTIDSQVISNGTNIPNIGNSIELLTGGLDITLSATGLINENSTTAEKESVITAIQTAYSSSPLSNNPIYSRILNTSDAETLAEELILNTPSGGTESSTPTEDTWQNEDPNCQISTDVTITGTDLGGDPVTQIWAPCNSTLGTGIEYDVDESCFDYEGGATTGCNRSSDELESEYNATYGVDNIWGKLYIWDNVSSACSDGRHVPTQEEWTILLKNLGCTDYGDETTTGWLCDGLGWAGHTLKDDTNNLENRLKLPMAGFRNSDGATFLLRGNHMHLWSSTENDSSLAGTVYLNRVNSTVFRDFRNEAYGLSVRCLKD